MRKTLSVLAALALATPVAAQQQAGMAGMNHDMTNMVHGSGKLVDGWQLRYDPQRGGKVPALDAVSMTMEGPAIHFQSGPAAIYYNTKDVGNGEYQISATFTQKKSMNHEAYGLFIGGKNLQDSTQTYTYFVIKPCSSKCGTAGAPMGFVLINQRTSNGKPATIVAERHDDAVVTDDPTDGHATNTMTIHLAKDAVHFVLNGKLVAEVPRSQLGNLDGIAGIRINHNEDLLVDWKGVSK